MELNRHTTQCTAPCPAVRGLAKFAWCLAKGSEIRYQLRLILLHVTLTARSFCPCSYSFVWLSERHPNLNPLLHQSYVVSQVRPLGLGEPLFSTGVGWF